MIHEKNKLITLDEQIAQIREAIKRGEQKFPIDIVDTIGTDSQLYYELETGYWERYKYNSEGDIVAYVDSLDVSFGNGLDDYLTEEPENVYQLDAIRFNKLRDIAEKENVTIITANQDTKPTELKVFLVDLNEVELFDNVPYRDCHDNFFTREAERQENGYTIKGYQNAINTGDISMNSKLIRFIK